MSNDYLKIRGTLPENFDEEDCLMCAKVHGKDSGSCPGDSGGIFAFTGYDLVNFELRTTQKAVVHGSNAVCDGDTYPTIFVRLDTSEILCWLFGIVFPDKVNSLSCTSTSIPVGPKAISSKYPL